MEVVDVGDARRVEDVAPDLRELDALGRGLEQHIHGLAQQPARSAA